MKPMFFASLLLLAWSSSPSVQAGSTNAGSTNLDACSLLTKAEVEAVTGAPPLEPASETGKLGDIPFSRCTFKKSEDLVDVVLTVYTYDNKADVQKHFDGSKPRPADAEQVNGLGDGAYWLKSTATLFVGKDKHIVSVLQGSGKGGSKAAQKIAGTVVRRITGE